EGSRRLPPYPLLNPGAVERRIGSVRNGRTSPLAPRSLPRKLSPPPWCGWPGCCASEMTPPHSYAWYVGQTGCNHELATEASNLAVTHPSQCQTPPLP